MHIEVIGKLGPGIVTLLGAKPRYFFGFERLVIVNLRKRIAYRSKPLDSVMGHSQGGIRFDAEVTEAECAAAIELARQQFELEGYGPDGSKRP